jgi:hypothetical protein
MAQVDASRFADFTAHLQGSVQQRRRRSDIMEAMKITLEHLRRFLAVRDWLAN